MILLPARYLWSEIFKIIINHLQFFFIETFVLLLLYFNICGTQVSIMIRTGKCSFGQVNLTDLSVRMTDVLKALFHSSASATLIVCAAKADCLWWNLERSHPSLREKNPLDPTKSGILSVVLILSFKSH